MESLRQLAPLHLENRRPRRYKGDDLCLDISVFEQVDEHAIRDLYAFLQRLLTAVSEGSDAIRRSAVLELLRERSPDDLVAMATPIGSASYRTKPSPLLAKTVHDIRGGGLTPLLGQLQFLKTDHSPEAIHALYFLTRDHF